MLRSNFRLVIINFDPKIKNEFAEIQLSYFEHGLYLIFIVGVIDNFIDNSFYCKNISYMSNFKELRNFNYGNSLL